MKSGQNEKIMDYLSCPLDDVVNREKKSGRNSFLNINNSRKNNYKASFFKKKDLTQSSSGYRGRGGGGGRSRFTSRPGSFKKPFFSNRLINKKFNNYKNKKLYTGGRDYFKSRPSSYNSHYTYDNHKIPYKNKNFFNRRNINNIVKSPGTTYRGSSSSIAKIKPRKIFKKAAPPPRTTVISSNLNSYQSVHAPRPRFNNLNISLYRNKRVITANNNIIKSTTNPSLKRSNVSTVNKSKVVRKGIQKTTIKTKTRKGVTGSKFKPLNKYFLSKIKIVTSLNKIPSPLKEQKDTEVNLPESLNNPSARKD
ncbi:hypothetical protein, conserved [Plasmodium gonderi]|uniref:Uncharacterized protein n=1 Tax=Plasmodium gonderi TaxID=77519 RepID=A0A1Y1JAF2_PLAGO|nr:hypothetical protein, conserved [Plasmodium gonderi]GAW79499.1 hypothetical protein, conserved [Plasmodium gonderi]